MTLGANEASRAGDNGLPLDERRAEPAVLHPDAVIARLEQADQALGREPRAPNPLLAFDADGTVWDVDVGVGMFEALLACEGVRAEAEEALLADARRFNIAVPPGSGVMGVARALHAAFFDGRYPDDLAYAMNAWAFAGWTESDAEAFADEVLRDLRVADRIRAGVRKVVEWAATREVDAYVVSASPVWIVRAGAAILGLSRDRVLAMSPAALGGKVEPRIEGPITYGDGKLVAIQSARPASILLGAFGDSAWDAAMLRAARVPVAVSPGPKLLEIAGTIPNLVVMDTHQE
jgi:phosphatidylglycerophosphatase C